MVYITEYGRYNSTATKMVANTTKDKTLGEAIPIDLHNFILGEANIKRIKDIKAKAKELILAKYTDEQQRNILMSLDSENISNMKDYILNIRNISNEAEASSLEVEDIDWKLTNKVLNSE